MFYTACITRLTSIIILEEVFKYHQEILTHHSYCCAIIKITFLLEFVNKQFIAILLKLCYGSIK